MKISKKDFPNVYDGFQYAEMVRDGKIDVPIPVKQMVKRFYTDIERAKEKNPPFFTDWDYAERYMRLTQKFKHAKGANWKSENIIYEPWQRFAFTYQFGFKNSKTKRRRFRSAFWEVSRGQGKSCLASQIGLYLLALDGEVGPEIYCASTKKDAARIVLDSARVMALKNGDFLSNTKTKVLAHHISHIPSHGIMKAISSDTSTNDGLNGSIIGDEIHEWKRELYDVLDSSLSKRDDSLFFMITTAGFSLEGIGYELYAYSKKVLSGDVIDDTWFALIYEMDEGDDWKDPKIWKKVNPNWGVSVDPINFEAKAKKAIESPAAQPNFLVKHLNYWMNTHTAFFDLNKWDSCADPTLSLEQFKGNSVFMGLDLASKIDLAAEGYVVEKDGIFNIFDNCYLPEARIMDNRNVQYARWAEEKYLNVMQGEVNDFTIIQENIIKLKPDYRIQCINLDPWSANETLTRLTKAGMNAFEFRMSVQNMSEAMKKLDALIREGKVRHNGSPLFRWCLGNVVAKTDANDNVYPRKMHERLKIDPVVAVIMAIAGYIFFQSQKKESIYETRGIRSL